jgi:hypothetical protein
MLVSGCTVSVKRFEAERPDRIGVLIVPAGGNRLPNSPTVYAADNGCFTELDTPKFLRMLAGIVRHDHPPLWVSCPDKVADAGETWRLFHRWAPMVREIGLPVAVVLQDGTERLKWRGQLVACSDMYDAVFVGGSTEFKLSPEAFRLTRDAHDAGKLVHFGRVNSMKRILRIARASKSGLAWCDTIDGGSATRWGDINIPKLIRWMDAASKDEQMVMF